LRIRNRTVAQGADQQVIAGVRKDLQGVAILYLGGRTFTPSTLEDYVQARIAAASAILVAKAAWQKAISDYEAVDAEASVVIRDLKRFIVSSFGDNSPKLADFGFGWSLQAPWPEERKKAAVAKRAATRKARNTLGMKAKLGVTAPDPSNTE
jgi:hypothetical protein